MDTKPMDPTLIMTRNYILRGHSYSNNYNNRIWDRIGVFGPLRPYHFDFLKEGGEEFLQGFSYAIKGMSIKFLIFSKEGAWS